MADLSSLPDLVTPVDAPPAEDLKLDMAQLDLALPDLTLPIDLQVDGMPDAGFNSLILAPCVAMLGVSAPPFAVLAGSMVTNTGINTTIVGDVGVSPGNAVNGIPAGQPTQGSIHQADPMAMLAQMDNDNVFKCSQAAVCTSNLTGQDLGGMTLVPGVYCFNSSATLTGNLVFDAKGDPNAIWFIQVMSTLTVSNNSQMRIINNGTACNVFWQIGSSVTVGTQAALAGNMLSLASITLNTGASVNGRALARNGAVTLDTNAITKCH